MPHHRRRTNKDADDEQLPPRAHESHGDPYARLPNDARQTSSYRRTDSTSSHSGRNSYDMNRASSSRSHRESSWRPKDTENRYNDGYYHERREEYDVTKSRESWSAPTPAHSNSTHSNSSHPPAPHFSERYWEHDAVSHFESSSTWGPSNTSHDHRNGHQERWQAQDTRGHAFKGRPPERTPPVEQRRDWNRDQRRGKDDQKWAGGSGWEAGRDSGRVEQRASAWVEPAPRWNPPPETTPALDNRAWEPAPTWQPSERHHRTQNSSRSDYNNNKMSTTGRRGAGTSSTTATHRNHSYTNNKPQRDWRNDDGNLNNWSRRESQGSERTSASASSPSFRKHLRSPSRSRSGSRSPAESYYSHRSSRGRTRSPSASPASKRRRRDSSPIAVAGRPSNQGGQAVWVPRQNSPFPQPSEGTRTHRHLAVGGRRSISPTSSMSAGRSPSRSGSANPDYPHSLPRLPAAVSAPAIISSPLNGNSVVNGAHNKTVRTQQLATNASIDIMPPPTIIPAVHGSHLVQEPSRTLPIMPRHPRIVAKNPGFKPIGQGSSSLKKFFPGDEEDMDISSDMSVVADADPPEPAPQPTTDVESRAQNDNQGSMPTSASAPDVSNDLPVPRRPSSPLAQSRGSSVVMEEEPPEPAHTLPQPSRPASPRLLTPRQPDLDPADNTGASTPSVQTRSELYAIVNQVGEGTFGKVYKAQNTVTKLHVALKRIRMESEKEGFPVTAMREIKLLQSLRHENVIRLYEMMVSNGSVYMVFEYMDHDLTGILSQTQFSFSDAHLKSLCHQMLAGLAYLHHKGVIHRDIKGSNILINNRGELKLGDFGLARFYQKRRRTDYTNRVITLWYRPPELLFGATIYGPEVDMWSAGCIMLELFTKKPVFQGNDEIHQLDTIYRVIGTPSPDRWPDVTNLPWYELVKSRDETPNHFREMFKKWMTPAALDLAEWLLCYNPAARATAVQAMDAPYFTQEAPVAEAPTGLATLHSEWHELDTKRERAKKRRRNDTVQ